jgi:pimeloyl-ACP methyl ester carboxylesterase
MPEIAQTALGPVEFEVQGTGRPVLVLHGSPGGWDAAKAMAGFLPEDEFQAILPSRPGYLGTPLKGAETIDEQADQLAALLDHLGIDQAGVLCWSGGGPSAYRLAVRHPERVSAIVSLTCVSRRFSEEKETLTEKLMFRTAPGNWVLKLMAEHSPEQLIEATEQSMGELSEEELKRHVAAVIADPVKAQLVIDVDATVTKRHDRKHGYANDMKQYAAIDDLELPKISAPTLVVWGDVDTSVAPAESEFAVAQIPNAEALVLPGGTHFAFYTHDDAAAAQARALTLLRG